MVKERRTVRGQSLEETCRASRNWKKREPGEVGLNRYDVSQDLQFTLHLQDFGTERTNDALILDCCQYFSRMCQRRTFLCSKDKILAVEAESAGMSVEAYVMADDDKNTLPGVPTIFPERGNFSSRDIAHVVFGYEAARFRFSGRYPVYRNDSMELVQDILAPDEDGMDVDDDSAVTQVLRPSHALDLLHLQAIDYFTELLLELVGVVGQSEVQGFGNGDYGSRHAPAYARKHIRFWAASDCLEYLDSKKRYPRSSPRVDVFLMKPYTGPGARRGQDWSRRDWEVALNTLGRIGGQWEAGSIIRDSVPAVEFHVSRIFSMPMRPTGL